MRFSRFLVLGSLVLFFPVSTALSDVGHDDQSPKKAPSETSTTDGGGHPAEDKPTSAKAGGRAGHWNAPPAEKARVNPVELTRDGLISVGDVYRENCAACHGDTGQGDGPLAKDLESHPADLFAMAVTHDDGELRWKIAKGRGEMPGWEDVLSDEQIWTLVHYLKTLTAFSTADNPSGG